MSDFKHEMSRLCHNVRSRNDTLKFFYEESRKQKRFDLLRLKEKGIVNMN